MKLFKKLVCLLLCVVLCASSCVVFSHAEGDGGFDFDPGQLAEHASQVGGFSLETPDLSGFEGYDIEELIASGALSSVNVGGMTLDEIYNSTEPIDWYKMTIEPSALYFTMANINLYLKNLIQRYNTNKTLYTSETATWLANQICAVVFGPNHDIVTVRLRPEQVGDIKEFVKEVIFRCRSGITSLVDIVQTNWLDADMNFFPLVYILGVNLDHIYFKDDVNEILEETLLAMIRNFLDNPLYSIIDVIWAVCRRYDAYMVPPMKALLNARIGNGEITETQFRKPHNVLNLIFNNNVANDGQHLQFHVAPYQRFAIAQDREEVFYYLLVYMMLLNSYKNNSNVIAGYKAKIVGSERLQQIDKNKLCNLIDGCTGNDISKMVQFVDDTLVDNLKESGETLWKRFLNRIKEILENFVKRLDDLFGWTAK